MRITIETHNEPDEKVSEMVEKLRSEGWDIFVNNHEPSESPTVPDDEPCGGKHNYVNGVCTRCMWLQV